jgi:hypothetical protein
VLIYVDDIIITSSNTRAISQLISDIHSSFALKDLGSLHFFLGVEVTWQSDGLHLSQQRYIHDILTKTNMVLAKPVSTLMSASTTLSRFEGSTITNNTLSQHSGITTIFISYSSCCCFCGQQVVLIHARPERLSLICSKAYLALLEVHN